MPGVVGAVTFTLMVAEAPGARSVLYRYKPLSGEFLRERFGELRALEAYAATVSALARVEGTSAYLRVLGTSYVPAFDHERHTGRHVLHQLARGLRLADGGGAE